ncbi:MULTISPECIES: ferritin family protein [unclassified Sedimentibacter]|uniref:ferritin family protein n=1 Tax=unclassified Sedimentibacter TaxID=2649220 RepID=UPI0027E085CB|nr:ferritin family protein [Sedimentibacter sp. MB35-C1]WMJ78874.1 ferritin family protein [Sedimentibacter sp. MB35-C1]
MTVKWNGTNLLKTIAENEKSAANLYRAIANEARIGEKFFEQLASDEERHEKIYNALLNKFQENIEIEIEQSDAEYVDMLIESNSLFDEELIENARKIYTKSQIFDIAEKAERDAVLFVSELQRLYPDMASDEVAIILNEERKHLKKVLERKKESQPMFGRGM